MLNISNLFKGLFLRGENRVYLDYASITPILPEVKSAMDNYSKKSFANPSSIYREGLSSKNALEEARIEIAKDLQVKPYEVFFTSGGTEGNNIAILGLANAMKESGKTHIITTVIEHPAVLEPIRELERQGFEVDFLSVGENGIVNSEDVKNKINKNTGLISIMQANNEIGTIQPIRTIGLEIKKIKKEEKSQWPYFHSDASQSPNYISISPSTLGVDLLALDGSKIYGPKGIGVLFKKKDVPLSPIIFGGGQEEGIRAGTENVPSAIGLAKALSLALESRKKESERLKVLQNYFFDKLEKQFPQILINGDKKNRLPNNINICLPDGSPDGEFTVLKMDAKGIALSSVTACRGAKGYYSHVIEAIGRKDCASRSLRITTGRYTTKKDIDKVIGALKEIL